MENGIGQVQHLSLLATKILSFGDSVSIESFGDHINQYLTTFQEWQVGLESNEQFLESLPHDEKAAFREAVVQLHSLHEQIVTLVSEKKTALLANLAELHKREKALKAYVDRYPARITITGKRKG